MMMMVMILIAAAATTAVVTFPFIERKVRLGLVESVLQLGDASPTFTTASFRLLLLWLPMIVAYCCCLWRWDLWLFLLLLLRVMMMVILIVAAIAVPKVFLPDVVLVEIEFVLFVVVVVLV